MTEFKKGDKFRGPEGIVTYLEPETSIYKGETSHTGRHTCTHNEYGLRAYYLKDMKLCLTDVQLFEGIEERRKLEGWGKLMIVKWVWENSDKSLKDSKLFVDNN